MATMVGGFLVPHVPLMVEIPHVAPEDKREVTWRAFATVAARLRALQVDTLITVGGDHYGMFGPGCVPQCLIGIGDVEGPMEDWLGLPREPMDNHAPLARHILETGFADGVAWSFASALRVDHATAVPHHLCYRQVPGLRVIPVYLNAGVDPVIPTRMAQAIGRSMGRAIETWPGSERVAVVGTGGCSHWVGGARMGQVNTEFDARMVELVKAGDIEGLVNCADAETLETAGNGALELRNWICAMEAMRCAQAELIAYQAVPEWVTGMCFAELKQAA